VESFKHLASSENGTDNNWKFAQPSIHPVSSFPYVKNNPCVLTEAIAICKQNFHNSTHNIRESEKREQMSLDFHLENKKEKKMRIGKNLAGQEM